MISTTLKDFMSDVFECISEDKPIITIKEIEHSTTKNTCSMYDREIGMSGNFDTQRSYVFNKPTGYNSNSRNEVRLYFCTGEDYVQYEISVGNNILSDFCTDSKLFTNKSYEFNDYAEFRSAFPITEETLEEYGRNNIIMLLVNETIKVLESIENEYNCLKIQKYTKIVEKCKENKAKTNSLITSLLNGDEVKEVKVTKDSIINQISNTKLTQEQLDNIVEVINK